jgi:hypothetical protein
VTASPGTTAQVRPWTGVPLFKKSVLLSQWKCGFVLLAGLLSLSLLLVVCGTTSAPTPQA